MTAPFVTQTPWTGGLQLPSYGAPDTYTLAAAWLMDCADVADWGGGSGYFGAFLPSDVKYRVVDGTLQCTDQALMDLRAYRTPASGILLRHVLELNVEWQRIVVNLLASFTQRACIVTYTPPFSKLKSGWNVAPVPRDVLRDLIAPFLVNEEAVLTPDAEHVFYLERRS